ncbi:unnamed protein product, partial [Prorocentrum cordatum]
MLKNYAEKDWMCTAEVWRRRTWFELQTECAARGLVEGGRCKEDLVERLVVCPGSVRPAAPLRLDTMPEIMPEAIDDPELQPRPPPADQSKRPPTERMLSHARRLALKAGRELTQGEETLFSLCSNFID